VKSLYCNTIFI